MTINLLEEKIYSLVPELKKCKKCIDGHEPFPSGEDGTDVEWEACRDCVKISGTKNTYEPEYFEIFPHHWLPLLENTNENWAICPDGQIMKQSKQGKSGLGWWVCEMVNNNPADVIWYPEYDFKKPLSEQSEEFRTWLLEQLTK